MKRVEWCVLAGLVAACSAEPGDPSEFRLASPSRQGLQVSFPNASSPLADPSGLAELFVVAHDAVQPVNRGLVFVQELLEQMIERPPAEADGSLVVWGPWNVELAPDEWLFTVWRSTGAFEYVLEARQRGEDAASYHPILSGRHQPMSDGGSVGAFMLDWEQTRWLADPPAGSGRLQYSYAREANGDVIVTAQFRGVLEQGSGLAVDASYSWAQLAGTAASLDFHVERDVHGQGTLPERWAVRARWLPHGPGRADARLTGGDLSGEVVASECWRADFTTAWRADSVDLRPLAGDPRDCVFAQQSLPPGDF